MGGDGNSPWWAVGIMAAIGVGYALFRFYDFMRSKNRVASRETSREDAADQREARRDAATEAWDVVERQNEEIGRLGERIQEIEARERKCAEDRAGDRMVLKILAVWSQRQKNPPPIPVDVLRQYTDGDTPSPVPNPK